MRELSLPDVGEGISEGELVEWRVEIGDVIEEGQIVAEVVTDKITFELPAAASGTVTRLCAAPGDVVGVGQVVLVLDGEENGDGGTNGGAEDTQSEHTRSDDTPSDDDPSQVPHPGRTDEGSADTGTTDGEDLGGVDPLASALGRVIAAPSTRRYAAEQDIDLTRVQGSGPGGRILRADVDQVVGSADQETSGVRRVPIHGVRSSSFDHMARSARTAATSTTTFEVHGDGLVELVAQLRPEAQARDVRVTPVVIVAACLATALGRHQRFNATIDEDRRELVVSEQVNLGIAVATDDGLVVPVVPDVGQRRLFDIAADLTSKARRARQGKLTHQDVRGGTFTLSSTGGIETATILSTAPVLNLPQVATLWVSRISDRPRVTDGSLEAGPVLIASLSFDHRVVDGAEVTAFINDLAALLAAPSQGLA